MDRDETLVVLADLVRAVAGEKLTMEEVADRLERAAAKLRSPSQLAFEGETKETTAPKRSDAHQIREVYEYWRDKTGHHQARLLPERAQKIRARLKQGFSVKELCVAIDGCLLSPHHTGDNEAGEQYTWIETIMKNGSSVEKHIERAMEGQPIEASAPRQRDPRIEEVRKQIESAKAQGRTQDANRLNKRLRELLQETRS